MTQSLNSSFRLPPSSLLSRLRFCSPAHVVAREARAPATFAEDGDAAVEGERRVVWASDAVGVAFGRGDVEDDALGLEGRDGSRAPVSAAAQDETRADGQRAERRRRGTRSFHFNL